MQHNRLFRQNRIGIQLLFHKFTGADDSIHHTISLTPVVKLRLNGSDQAFDFRVMDTAILRTLHEITAAAGKTDLSGGRYPHHMVRTYPLIVMGSKHKLDFSAGLLLIVTHCIDHRGGKLKINIVQMHYIRLKIL